MTSAKKLKNLSSFGFTSSRSEKSTKTVLNAYTNNRIYTIEAATSDSDWILISSANNHVSLNRQSAAALTESSSSLDSMELENDIGNYINSRLKLSNKLRYLLLTQHFAPDEQFKGMLEKCRKEKYRRGKISKMKNVNCYKLEVRVRWVKVRVRV